MLRLLIGLFNIMS